MLLGLVFCSCGGKKSELVGEWHGWVVIDGVEPSRMTEYGNQWTLILNEDGSFEEHLVNNVMMKLVQDTKGAYERKGNTLVMAGEATYSRDDGYSKDSGKMPISYRLTYADGVLRKQEKEHGGRVVFMRPGQVPKYAASAPPLVENDAEELLGEVVKAYEVLESYADDGTMTSVGEGFLASKVIFRTRYAAPHQFLFDASLMDGREVYERQAVWRDGQKSWLRMGEGEAERPLGNALSTLSPTTGYVTMLVPRLLMPPEFGEEPFSEEFAATLRPDQKIGGVSCRVLGLENQRGSKLTLWVGKSTKLIVQAKHHGSGAVITYKPRANPKLKVEDLKPRPAK